MSESILAIPVTFIISLIVVAGWHTYSTRGGNRPGQHPQQCTNRIPSTFPYRVPLIGSLPITYIWNPLTFVLNPNNFFQSSHPTRVKILSYEFYVVRGQDNVKALFKASRLCSSIPFVKFALGYAFGLPAAALKLYDKDDSGGERIPHPDSSVTPHNRIDWLVHQSLSEFLEGRALSPLCKRFADNITQRVHHLRGRIGSKWVYHPDLMKLIGDEATIAIVNALCGPHLLRLNPNFLRDYWEFDRNLQTYLRGVPWVFAPKAYAARKRVLNAVKVWQQHARDNFDPSKLDSDGDDPHWGSSFFRKRQRMFLKMDGFDHDSIASEDFGAIWAARNAISASSWAIYDIFRDPHLLATVRAEVASCMLSRYSEKDYLQFDIERLLALPTLQAVYAETLRLRMHFFIIRMPDKVDIPIQDWIIPRKKVIVVSTTVAHRDSGAWNIGRNKEYPLDIFWAGRFLSNRSMGLSQPLVQPTQSRNATEATEAIEFSLKGLEASWIPYGGGPRQCPGRHFAKRQILHTIALVISLLDCEILGDGMNLKESHSLSGFGSGISHPAGQAPVKIRSRGEDQINSNVQNSKSA